MTVLDELQKVMPPPAKLRGPRETWDDTESILEVTFPVDFKDFVNVYGNGFMDHELGFDDPCRVFEFWKRIEFQQKYRDWDQDQFGYPFPAYPAPGERCLLEVGGNGNGDKICLVVGDEGTVSEDELWIVNLSSLFFMGIPGPLVELVYDLATRSGRFHIIDQALLPEEPENSVWRLAPQWG